MYAMDKEYKTSANYWALTDATRELVDALIDTQSEQGNMSELVAARKNGLEGCMSGRLAMNTPWECARIDREIFGDYSRDTMTREEIILAYADFAQDEQDKAWQEGVKISSNIFVKPLVFLFHEEY